MLLVLAPLLASSWHVPSPHAAAPAIKNTCRGGSAIVMKATSDARSLDPTVPRLAFVATMSSFFIKPFFRPEVPTDLTPTWDVAAAKAAAKEGALCPSVSCSDVAFAKVQASLDTSSLRKNAAGAAVEHMPIAYAETTFGLSLIHI